MKPFIRRASLIFCLLFRHVQNPISLVNRYRLRSSQVSGSRRLSDADIHSRQDAKNAKFGMFLFCGSLRPLRLILQFRIVFGCGPAALWPYAVLDVFVSRYRRYCTITC